MRRGILAAAAIGLGFLVATPADEGRAHASRWDTSALFLQEERGPARTRPQIAVRPACDVKDPRTDERIFAVDGALFHERDSGPAQAMRFKASWDRHIAACDIDARGDLWLGVRGKGIAQRMAAGEWKFYTGDDGVPFDQFTTVTADGDAVWFGTTRGAIRYEDGRFAYRNAPRWLPGELVRSIAQKEDGVEIITDRGVVHIRERMISLEEKASFFERQIAQRHNRDGFVCQVYLKTPGDRQEWMPKWTDNDGLWTGLYVAAESFRYAVTGDKSAQENAHRSAGALMRLQDVTGIPGFPARAMWPTTEPDPGGTQEQFSIEGQKKKQRVDPLWKVLPRRWPVSADGNWYWKGDTSGAEIDGHLYAYATYYDLAITDGQERERVRRYVRALADHILEHGYALVDYDGTATRFGWWGPQYVNATLGDALLRSDGWRDALRKIEGSVSGPSKSLSLLTHLKTAAHITGDARYERQYRKLIDEEHYAQNVTRLKTALAPRAYYDGIQQKYLLYDLLLRYEQDPELRSIYTTGLRELVDATRQDRNPLFNFIGATRLGTAVAERELLLEDGIATLKDIPLDTVEYTMRNTHRKDLRTVWSRSGKRWWSNGQGKIYPDGLVGALPISEVAVLRWSQNPYHVDRGRSGEVEEAPTHYLLPYYLGRHHGIIINVHNPGRQH